jgi:hypothetical protein
MPSSGDIRRDSVAEARECKMLRHEMFLINRFMGRKLFTYLHATNKIPVLGSPSLPGVKADG